MADTLLCLDIHKDTVAAVIVDRSTKTNLVTGCSTVEIDGRSFELVIDQIKEQTGFVSGTCRVTFGAELFSFRNLTLPFTDKKKIEQVLPFELDDCLPVETKSMLVDFVVVKDGPQGADIIAAMISREYLADKLAILSSRGINPEWIGISGLSAVMRIAEEDALDSFLLIDVGTKWATVFIVLDGKIALIRALSLTAILEKQVNTAHSFFQSVKQTLLACRLIDITCQDYCVYVAGMVGGWIDAASLSHYLGGVKILRPEGPIGRHVKLQPDIQRQYQPAVMDRILGIGLGRGVKDKGFNFCKDDFRKRKSLSEHRQLVFRCIVPLVCIVLATLGYWGHEYRNLLVQQEQLRKQIVDVFQETIPDVERIVNPVQQLQVINNQIRSTYTPGGDKRAGFTVIDLLAELSSRIPGSYYVKIVRLVADADTLRLKAITGDYNTVDNIQKELEKSHFFKNVIINSANQSSQNDEVSFELKLDFAGK